jgi:holliday junction DNA helicase RuvA
MIALLNGVIYSKSINKVVLDVNGIGFDIAIPLSTYDKLPDPGESKKLHIYTHITENTISLFGFATAKERDYFLMLIPINKIGPKVAMSVLSFYSYEVFTNNVVTENITELSKIPGIGKKTAERLILELKEKIGRLNIDASQCLDSDLKNESSFSNDAISALIQLGFSQKDAVISVNKVLKETPDLNVEDIIKSALSGFRK